MLHSVYFVCSPPFYEVNLFFFGFDENLRFLDFYRSNQFCPIFPTLHVMSIERVLRIVGAWLMYPACSKVSLGFKKILLVLHTVYCVCLSPFYEVNLIFFRFVENPRFLNFCRSNQFCPIFSILHVMSINRVLPIVGGWLRYQTCSKVSLGFKTNIFGAS